jgi:threonine aldolase
MQRRTFLAAPIFAAAAGTASAAADSLPVQASGDGIHHTPMEYAALLQKLSPAIEPDDYSRGGVVAKLERSVAAALGKETAVWVSTGTLANHLAVRLLAGDRRRVLVQQECHLFNDCGDCCQTLSGLNLIPLAPGKATFTVDDLEREASRGASGRVSVPIGAIQIETPVRRRNGENFDIADMKRVSQWARERKIGLHLDGARLFLGAAYTGVSVREYAALFDTVYVSMYNISTPPAEPSSLARRVSSKICFIRAACSAMDLARCGPSLPSRSISSRASPSVTPKPSPYPRK